MELLSSEDLGFFADLRSPVEDLFQLSFRNSVEAPLGMELLVEFLSTADLRNSVDDLLCVDLLISADLLNSVDDLFSVDLLISAENSNLRRSSAPIVVSELSGSLKLGRSSAPRVNRNSADL